MDKAELGQIRHPSGNADAELHQLRGRVVHLLEDAVQPALLAELQHHQVRRACSDHTDQPNHVGVPQLGVDRRFLEERVSLRLGHHHHAAIATGVYLELFDRDQTLDARRRLKHGLVHRSEGAAAKLRHQRDGRTAQLFRHHWPGTDLIVIGAVGQHQVAEAIVRLQRRDNPTKRGGLEVPVDPGPQLLLELGFERVQVREIDEPLHVAGPRVSELVGHHGLADLLRWPVVKADAEHDRNDSLAELAGVLHLEAAVLGRDVLRRHNRDDYVGVSDALLHRRVGPLAHAVVAAEPIEPHVFHQRRQRHAEPVEHERGVGPAVRNHDPARGPVPARVRREEVHDALHGKVLAHRSRRRLEERVGEHVVHRRRPLDWVRVKAPLQQIDERGGILGLVQSVELHLFGLLEAVPREQPGFGNIRGLVVDVDEERSACDELVDQHPEAPDVRLGCARKVGDGVGGAAAGTANLGPADQLGRCVGAGLADFLGRGMHTRHAMHSTSTADKRSVPRLAH